jgi:hypothetical protein
MVGTGTNTVTSVSPSTTGYVLTSNGAAADPSFQPNSPSETNTANARIDFVDEFLYGITGGGILTTSTNFGFWDTAVFGTSAIVVLQDPLVINNAHPGTVTVETGTTSTGSSAVSMLGLGPPIIVGGGTLTLTYYFNIPTLSTVAQTYTITIGLSNINGIPTTDGIWLSYTNAVNTGQWVCNTAASSAVTNSNSSTAVSTGWQVAQIVVNAAGSSVSYFVGTTLAGLANIGTINTNIPTTNAFPTFALTKSNGTNTAKMSLDLITIAQTLTTPR